MRHIIQTKTVLFSTLKLTLLLMLTSCLQIGQSVHDEKALDSAKHIEPIQALYITNYSSFWHDYDEQQKLIREQKEHMEREKQAKKEERRLAREAKKQARLEQEEFIRNGGNIKLSKKEKRRLEAEMEN